MKTQDRFPKKGGAAAAVKKLKEMRKKEPSDRLVKIIEEVTNQEDPMSEDKPKIPKKGAVKRLRELYEKKS